MNEDYRAQLAVGVEKKYRQLENDIMEDVVRRIQKASRITETADWQIQRYELLGHSADDVREMVSKALEGTDLEVSKLYADVISREYGSFREIYQKVGKEFIPFEENTRLQQLTAGLIAQSNEDLYNITKSMGFMVPINGQNVFTPLSDIYNGYLDQAIVNLSSGAFDYNTVIRRTVNMMTNSGLRTSYNFSENEEDDYGIDYPSGWHNRINVAARRAVLTGASQLTGEISKMNAKNLDTEYYEVSWHVGARPSHQEWQGQVYDMRGLEDECGYGDGAGLLGWNCRHTFYPFIPGVSERTYTDEWLEEQNEIENTPKEWNGKEYTTYELTQKQRQMETRMRAQRQKVELMKKGDADKDDVTIQRCKYQAQLDEYKTFCKKFGFKEQRERIYYDLKGRVAPSQKTVAKYTSEMIKNAERDSAMYQHRKEVLGDNIVSLAEFRQAKYNNIDKYNALEHDYDVFKKINAKPWTAVFKKETKDAYIYLRDKDTLTNEHSISRIVQRAVKGSGLSLDGVANQWHMKPNYIQPDGRKVRYYNKVAIIGQNGDTEIASLVERNNPKKDWIPL